MDPKVNVLLVVKFKTSLTIEEVLARSEQRMPEFRALSGLLQKYYCREEKTGEVAGVYLWDSQASLERFLGSELRKTIPAAYAIEGPPRIEVLQVAATLR